MLQEVGKTVLGRIFLLDGAYVRCKIEFRTSLGEFIVADVIGESVLKMADSDLCGIGEFGHLADHSLHLLAGRFLCEQCGGYNCQSKKTTD